ncbi:branched-chain amino acid ABC transporter permease [Bradyrhizobium sp. UFLA05-153]|uniref:branched-chain amino acid ABC transporter permease n=1 Tax=Bradyrhizobium sp. Ec3.3 TaxID=189753 RepID=UPI000401E7E8|nr:branched-chain amino acid ABC transporter permease [Bradyrhizobium sp. Ec3.3]
MAHGFFPGRSAWLIAYTLVVTLLCVLVFTGNGLIDTVAFLALLAPLFIASDFDKCDPRVGMPVLAFVLLCALPLVGMRNTFYLDVAIQVGIFAVLALGLNIVVGFAGLLDLGFIAFFAVGAYLWAIVSSPHGAALLGTGFPLQGDAFFVIAIVAVFVAAGTGALLGLPVLRLKGDYLAIVTLGFGEVIRVLANNLDKPLNITNGPQGIAGIAQPLTEVAGTLATTTAPAFKWQALIYYAVVLTLVLVAVLANRRLDSSSIGRSWLAIREDEIAAQAMGVPLVRTKLIAFATGAAFAGTMGVLFAAKQTFVSPESFDFNQSIGVLAMIVLGGLGSIRGVMMGAGLVTILNLQVLKSLSAGLNHLRATGFEIFGWSFANLPTQFEPSKYERLIFGLILIAMMLYRPRGLVPAERRPISAGNAGSAS